MKQSRLIVDPDYHSINFSIRISEHFRINDNIISLLNVALDKSIFFMSLKYENHMDIKSWVSKDVYALYLMNFFLVELSNICILVFTSLVNFDKIIHTRYQLHKWWDGNQKLEFSRQKTKQTNEKQQNMFYSTKKSVNVHGKTLLTTNFLKHKITKKSLIVLPRIQYQV